MKIEHIHLPYDKLEDPLLPKFIGRVFHVTHFDSFQQIVECGFIKPNTNGTLNFTFPQSENSFFRRKGCVCVFDLRSVASQCINDSLLKYNFLNPFVYKREHVYIFLSEKCFEKLIPWTQQKIEKAYREMVIPHVEAGYPGEIDVSLFNSILHVKVDEPLARHFDPI